MESTNMVVVKAKEVDGDTPVEEVNLLKGCR